MTTLTLTKAERQSVVDWLNGSSGDPDYFITRETGNTHVKRQTVNTVGGKWKVRIAYEADTGYPLAMGSPIQASSPGKHEKKLGQASIPADHKAKPAPPKLGYLWPAPKSALSFLIDEPVPAAFTPMHEVKLETKYGPIYLNVGEEYTGQFVKKYGLDKAIKLLPGYKMKKVTNMDLFKVIKEDT